ncbi:MAG: DUF423 domain-containing protein [Saprospiraceae bacterium]|nr:DUF423 domain-containing protein [Saprospiraceae bacterium]
MRTTFLRWTAIFGILAVIFGAFGAHFLESQLGPSRVETFNTGVRYQFYHTLALFLLAILIQLDGWRFTLLRWAGYCFIIGVITFSGSLYLLSTSPMTGLEVKWLGPITPLGGTFFIGGWLLLLLCTFKKTN